MIILPTSPLPQSATPRPLDYGAWQEPIGGGAITRLDRLGNRFAIDVVMPRMAPEPRGRIWVARLVSAIGGDAQLPFPQPGLDLGNPGTPVVNSAGQGGSALLVKTFTPGYTIREGQFFNLYDVSGRPYLHQVSADVVADGNGSATLPIWPMMRTSPYDGTLVNFFPVIAGRLTGNEKGWTLQRAGTEGLQFTITERR